MPDYSLFRCSRATEAIVTSEVVKSTPPPPPDTERDFRAWKLYRFQRVGQEAIEGIDEIELEERLGGPEAFNRLPF